MFVATTPGPDGSPKIMRDDNGKLVEDPRSAVFCPLKEGTTTLTMRVAGTATGYQPPVGSSALRKSRENA